MNLIRLAEPFRTHAAAEGLPVNMVVDLEAAPAVSHRRALTNDLVSYSQWIDSGKNGTMSFMERNIGPRKDPNLILHGAKSAIVFAVPYASGKQVRTARPTGTNASATDALIAKYARGKDYHTVIKKRLDQFGQKHFGAAGVQFRSIVDSVPFLERAHARISGLGFIGKNTMLIRPGMGSYFFLATLLLDCKVEMFTEVAANNAITDLNCGSCRLCLDACPTGALDELYQLDANKCLSYWTIESRNTVPDTYVSHMKDTIFGCDICQDVCPYNLKTSMHLIWPEFQNSIAVRNGISVLDIANMSFEKYQVWFGGSAMTRAKYSGLVRNALYHLFATNFAGLDAVLMARQGDGEKVIAKAVMQILKIKGSLPN